jgi:hypothetical protein
MIAIVITATGIKDKKLVTQDDGSPGSHLRRR